MTYPMGMRTCLARSCSNTAGLRGARALVFLCMVIDSTLSKQKETPTSITSITSQSLVLMIIFPNPINYPCLFSLSFFYSLLAKCSNFYTASLFSINFCSFSNYTECTCTCLLVRFKKLSKALS